MLGAGGRPAGLGGLREGEGPGAASRGGERGAGGGAGGPQGGRGSGRGELKWSGRVRRSEPSGSGDALEAGGRQPSGRG